MFEVNGTRWFPSFSALVLVNIYRKIAKDQLKTIVATSEQRFPEIRKTSIHSPDLHERPSVGLPVKDLG